MARKLCHEKIWVKTLRSGFCRRVQKMVQKLVETYFSQQCPKSISLDSGHLDKPFGPLIFNFFQYFWTICLTDFSGEFCLFPRFELPSNMVPIGPVWAGHRMKQTISLLLKQTMNNLLEKDSYIPFLRQRSGPGIPRNTATEPQP